MSETNLPSLIPLQIVAVPSAPAVLEPRCALSIRPAEKKRDLPFMDALQKMHTHMVGWFPSKQMEEYIDGGHVLIAEDAQRRAMGYCIAKDHYMGRDDVGIVYQLNVAPGAQRHLVGAMLVKAWFDKTAYGCRLFSCWCAQDIQANFFWEAMGFVPIAFRAGSRGKQRIHIFWQRRIADGDQTTPYWYPYQTGSGAIREDRLVLPIPSGTHWRDAKPIVLPGVQNNAAGYGVALPAPKAAKPVRPAASVCQRMAVVRSKSRHLKGTPAGKAAVMTAGGLRYVERGDYVPEPAPPKPKRAAQPKSKNDPKLVAATRELRDRWLEDFNRQKIAGTPKYAIGRGSSVALPAPNPTNARRSLPHAA
jgi:hypothetical protein